MLFTGKNFKISQINEDIEYIEDLKNGNKLHKNLKKYLNGKKKKLLPLDLYDKLK